MLWQFFECLIEQRDRLFAPALLLADRRKTCPGLGIVWSEFDGLLEMLRRFVELAGLQARIGETGSNRDFSPG